MAGLPKKYFKMFPGNLKRAWAQYKRDKGSTSGGHAGKKTQKKKGGATMAKAKSKAKAGVKRFRQAMETRPGKIVRFGLEATGGAVVTSLAVNKMPVIREQSQGIKSGAQGATGLAMVFLGPKRWPIVKRAGAGAIIAAIMGGVKAVLKVDPLAGPPSPGGRTLSNEAMRRITGGRVGMGRPANVTMGRPANVTMNGSGSGGWNPGWG